MLTDEQRSTFDEQGFLRIPKAFEREDAAAMEDRIWEILGHRYGVSRDDSSNWAGTRPTNLRAFKTNTVFRSIGSDITVATIDDLLGAGRWARPNHWGQFLITFPAAETEWTVPARAWHTDFPFGLPRDRLGGLILFSFIADVAPRSGGTTIVVGGHHLVRKYIEARPHHARTQMKVARKALFDSDPWLRALASQADDSDRIQRFMKTDHEVAGVPVRVAELTAEAGDVVVCHPWLLHAISPNCGERPRMSCVQRIYAS